MRALLLLLPGLLVAAPPDGHLLEAIHQGDVHFVEAALKAGADPNTRDDLGSTALMHAGAYCSVECMKVLIAAGANVNAASNAGFTALMWSVSDPAKVKLLLAAHADVKARSKDGNTAVLLARQNAWADSVPLLLAAGAADEDGMQPGAGAILKMSRDHLLQVRSTGVEPMHFARQTESMFIPVHMFGGPVEPVKALLDAGVDANAPTRLRTMSLPPLALAAHYGNTGQVELLLARGANPNARGYAWLDAAYGGRNVRTPGRRYYRPAAEKRSRDRRHRRGR
jgi:ankyrin repeat protein